MSEAAARSAERMDVLASGILPSPARELVVLWGRVAAESVEDAFDLAVRAMHARTPQEGFSLAFHGSVRASQRGLGCLRDVTAILRGATTEASAM